MVNEAWKLKDQNNTSKEKIEKDNEQIKKKNLEHKAVKEKISIEIEAENQISKLKELIESWVISKETAEKIIEWENISESEINDIFNKIDEIEEIKNIDDYLPKELRINHDEYIKALHDDIFRVQILTKLNSALALISKQINPDSAMWLNLFSWFLIVLDKNLIKVQENTIDIKDNLEVIEEKKYWKKIDNRNIFQKIIDFVKEVFSSKSL